MQSLLRSFAGSDAMSGCLCTGSHVKRKKIPNSNRGFLEYQSTADLRVLYRYPVEQTARLSGRSNRGLSASCPDMYRPTPIAQLRRVSGEGGLLLLLTASFAHSVVSFEVWPVVCRGVLIPEVRFVRVPSGPVGSLELPPLPCTESNCRSPRVENGTEPTTFGL